MKTNNGIKIKKTRSYSGKIEKSIKNLAKYKKLAQNLAF